MFINLFKHINKPSGAMNISNGEIQIKTNNDEVEELFNNIIETAPELRKCAVKMIDMVKQKTAIIERAKKQWEDTFDAIISPLFVHDAEFRIIRANKAYARIAGMSFKDIINKPYFEVFPKREKPFKICLEILESQHETSEEAFLAETNKIYKMKYYPVPDEQGRYRCSIHILEDITEAKQATENIKREAEINRTLLSAAEALSATLDKEEIFKKVVNILSSVMKVDRLVIFLRDNELEAFTPVHTYKMPKDLEHLFMRVKITREIPIVEKLQQGEVVIIEDARETPLFPADIAKAFGLRAIMYAPIISRGKNIGIIGADRIEVNTPFNDKEKTILRGITYQIATALENASLYRETLEKTIELNRKIETLSVMQDIDRSILSTSESDEILEKTIMIISRFISCDGVIVTLVDNEKCGFLYKAGFGIPLQKESFISFDATTKSKIINAKRPEFIADLSKMENLLSYEKFLLTEGFLAHVRVPITVKDKVIATLDIGAKKRSAFTSDDLSTLEKIAGQIGMALENIRHISDLKELFIGTIKCLSSSIDAKSPWTMGHSDRVTEYSIKIGKQMGLNDKDLEELRIAGLLHDIGKIGTYDVILDKPGKLTDEEYEIVKKHSVKGCEMLLPIKQLSHIIPWIRGHHERFDGKGYPDGLIGEQIPLQARILAVADTFDSMTAERPYRNTPGEKRAVEELKTNAGAQFDPKVLEVFFKVLKGEEGINNGS